MILIYAFSNHWGTNISHRTLLDLQKLIPPSSNLLYQLIYFHPRQFFRKYIQNNQYTLIIGLGDHSRDLPKIRIETAAHNRYGDSEIYPFTPYRLDLALPILDIVDTSVFSVSENMGSYNCNWIAYQIQRSINDRFPQTRQLFFHLPKRANSRQLALQLQQLFVVNNLLNPSTPPSLF